MKLTKQTPNPLHLPCMQFLMLVSSTICAIPGYKYWQNAQAAHQHHTRHIYGTTYVHSDTILGLLAQLHAMQTLPCQ